MAVAEACRRTTFQPMYGSIGRALPGMRKHENAAKGMTKAWIPVAQRLAADWRPKGGRR